MLIQNFFLYAQISGPHFEDSPVKFLPFITCIFQPCLFKHSALSFLLLYLFNFFMPEMKI
jgi:hypothetical protein